MVSKMDKLELQIKKKEENEHQKSRQNNIF